MLIIPKQAKFVGRSLDLGVDFYDVKFNNQRLTVGVSKDDDGKIVWEHISVETRKADRIPTYEEMNFIKQIFWEPEDEVIHFFPSASKHVNVRKNCLHLWRPTGVVLPWDDEEN